MMDLFIEQLGKAHLLILHFPVVLVQFLPIILAVSLLKRWPYYLKVFPHVLYFSALSAIGASFFGLLLAHGMGSLQGDLWWHRLMGVILSVYLVLFSVIYYLKKPNLEQRIPIWVWGLTFVSVGLVVATAHMGGVSVHGDLLILGAD